MAVRERGVPRCWANLVAAGTERRSSLKRTVSSTSPGTGGDELAGRADSADGGAFQADRLGDDRYEFTMEDPEMFTRPWTARLPLTTNQAARGVPRSGCTSMRVTKGITVG